MLRVWRCVACAPRVDFFSESGVCPLCEKPAMALMTIHLHSAPDRMACGEERQQDEGATGEAIAVTCPACLDSPELESLAGCMNRRLLPVFVFAAKG